MSRDRDDVEAEIVLPAGMELVVPPAARPTHSVAPDDDGQILHPRPRNVTSREESRRPPSA